MIARLILSAVAVWLAAEVMDGVTIDHWGWTVVIAIVMGLINSVVRPVVKLLSLPINILTLGLFTLVINGAMVMLCAYCVPAFHVDTFGTAIIYSVILIVINWLLNLIFNKE